MRQKVISLAVASALMGMVAPHVFAGGFSLGTPISNSYDPVNQTGWVQPDADTGGINNGSISGEGSSPLITVAGDPVNMISGNVYHLERDIALKGRGLPIVFERSYNSRTPKDGVLGYGWTHSFNHTLTFKDDNADGTVNAGDSDGVTSSVVWTDGTGADKIMPVSGNAGGVPAGATLTPPQGHFFTATRSATDNTYIVTEKGGLSYVFENVAGTVGQKARLIAIKDRNGNKLTLTYTGSQLTEIKDDLERKLTLTYLNNRISEISDWDGRKYQYDYDANGNLLKYKNPLVVDGLQTPVVYEYYTVADGTSLNHALKKYTLPRGNGMTFEYYSNGKASRHYTTNGESTSFGYNEFRRESWSSNERGGVRRYFFNENGNLIKLVEENGAERRYEYAHAGFPYNRTAKIDLQGRRTEYSYDTKGNVTQVKWPSGATVLYSNYTTFGQPGKIKDANGNYTLFKYSAKGELLQRIHLKQGVGASVDPVTYSATAGDVMAMSVTSYDGYGNPTSIKQVRDVSSLAGPSLEFDYNDTTNAVAGLNPVKLTRRGDKDGNGTIDAGEYDQGAQVFDKLGRGKEVLRGDWYLAKQEYDKVDRVKRATDALNQWRDFRYDANGNLIEQSLTGSQQGASTALDRMVAQYDLSDRKVSSSDAAGNITAYQYDAAGNVTKITNPDGYSVGFDYDSASHVVRSYDQEGSVVSRELDPEGVPRKIIDPNGNSLRYEYYGPEKNGWLKKSYDALGRAIAFDYDLGGNITSVTDTAGRTTYTQYDEFNRPVRIVGPEFTDAKYGVVRAVTRYTYNLLGFLTQVDAGRTTDPLNKAQDVVTTQQTNLYDDFGRKLKETDALGKSWLYQYDVNGNVTKITDPKAQITSLTWSYGHLLKRKQNATGNDFNYTYNALGQVTVAQGWNFVYSYDYDPAHRLESLTDRRANKKFTYRYSPGGLLNSLEDSEGNLTSYLYDRAGRLSGIRAPGNENLTYLYDAGGRLVEKWLPNGNTARYQYNADNTLSQIINRSGGGSIVSQHDYSYDPQTGQRLTHTENINGTNTAYSYVYDELKRLKEVKVGGTSQESYTYDALDNRYSKTAAGQTSYYIYDAANQLKEIRLGSETGTLQASYSYDDAGNLALRDVGGVKHAFGYNGFNQVNQIRKDSLSGTWLAGYSYDDQGRRISKSDSTGNKSLFYNGDDLYAVYKTNEWAKAQEQYTHGPAVDDPVLMRDSTGKVSYFHADGLGSVVAATDTSNAVTSSARYDAWGNTIASSGSALRYGYTGREPEVAGLIYYRARWYDPSIGRFTQRDPIGLAGGVNQFAYVRGNPVNFTDPTGLRADLTYFNSTKDPIAFKGAMNTPTEPGIFKVAGHGNPYRMDDASGKAILPAAMARSIVANPRFVDGMTVRLMSCNTGICPTFNNPAYAQQVAAELGSLGRTGVVQAANNFVWFKEDGSAKVAGSTSGITWQNLTQANLKTFEGSKADPNQPGGYNEFQINPVKPVVGKVSFAEDSIGNDGGLWQAASPSAQSLAEFIGGNSVAPYGGGSNGGTIVGK